MASANAVLKVEAASSEVVYVGPRPFETGERLYGRDREASELLSLLIAERIVLLHSPSGAGKTSVVQALLLPEIRDEGFVVPESADDNRRGKPLVIRVNNPPPADAPAGCNRYALSVLLSLEEHRPKADRRDALLAGMELDAYLRAEFAVPAKGSSKPPPLLLVFDQFEEVLTLDPTDRPAKEAFFQQLGTALRDRTRWALFASRDDFVAALEPYRNHIPTGLNVTYRLDFLSERSARDAIVEPAKEAGAVFNEDLVAKLLEELRLVRVQQPDGTFKEELGPSVEPVQLQVVCRRLWQVRQDPNSVTLDDLIAIKGDQGVGVDVVLAEYYAATVSEAAANGSTDERLVRDWFGRKLIVAGIRRPVLRGEESEDGINANCLRVLENAFLIRSEPRGGAFWYELAHDRLIGPVQKNNECWRSDHLNPFQLQAESWYRGNRPDGLLVRGELLKEGKQWDAATPDGKKTQAEKDFLKACREIVKREREKRQRLRNMAILATAVVLLGGLILISLKRSQYERGEAERLRQEAELQGRVLQTQTKGQPDGRSAVVDALNLVKNAPEDQIASHAAEGLLRSAMAGIGWEKLPLEEALLNDAIRKGVPPPNARPDENPVKAAGFSPKGQWLAAGRRDGAVVVWKIDRQGRLLESPIRYGLGVEVSALSFSPEDSDLVVGFGDGRFEIVDPKAPYKDKQPQQPKVHESAVREIVFSSDSKWFTTVALDGTSLLWSREGFRPIMDLSTIENSVVTSLTFTPFPKRMYFGTTDGKIHSLNLLSSPPKLDEHRLIAPDVANKPVAALAVHPSARMTAIAWSGGYTGFRTLSMDPRSKAVHEVTEVIGGAYPDTKDEKTRRVSSVASLEFSDDGLWLVSRTRDHQMRLWAVTNDFRLGFVDTFSDTGLPLESVKFGPLVQIESAQGSLTRTRWLLGEVADGSVLLWDLNTPRNVPLALRGHKGPLTVACFDPRGKWLLTSCFDGTNRLWDLERLADTKSSAEPRVILHDAPVLTGGFSTAQNRIATFTNRGELRSLDLDSLEDQKLQFPESKLGFPRSGLAFSADGDSVLVMIAAVPLISKVWRPGDPTASDRPNPIEAMFPNSKSILEPLEVFLRSGYVLSADRRFLAGLDMSGNVVVVDPMEPNKAEALRIPISSTLSRGNGALGFSPDGKHLIVAQQDIGVKLWDLQSGPGKAVPSGEASFPWQTPLKPFPGAAADETSKGNENHDTTAVAISNDGKLLAAASRSVVWVWERSGDQSFTPIIVLRGQTGAVRVLVFTPDGEKLVSGSDDSTVRIWHLKPTPKLDAFVPLLGHKGPVTSASISPDGKLLLTTSLDGTARVWTLDRKMLLDRAKEMTREPEMARVRARY
jgi:WD40 repeat protein